jgi:hypothetical protein
MLGQCGRDGRKGLAIMFVESHQKNGKNSVSDFTPIEFQNNNDRMDALAITPVCLKITFSLDNLYVVSLLNGYDLCKNDLIC